MKLKETVVSSLALRVLSKRDGDRVERKKEARVKKKEKKEFSLPDRTKAYYSRSPSPMLLRLCGSLRGGSWMS